MLLYDVREAAGEVLGKLIDHNNVLLIRSLASVFSCRDVETRAHNFMLERFEIVSKTEEFLKLDAEEVIKYLSMDDIIVKSEESIFQCILRWIQVDEENRAKHFDELVKTVRFPLVSEHYINTEMENNPYVKNSEVCKNLIKEAAFLKSQQTKSFTHTLHKSGKVPQYRGSNQLLFLQCSNISPWLKTPPVLFDFKKTTWKSLGGPISPCRYREGSCYVYHHHCCYSFGGEYSLEPADHHHHLGTQLNTQLRIEFLKIIFHMKVAKVLMVLLLQVSCLQWGSR